MTTRTRIALDVKGIANVTTIAIENDEKRHGNETSMIRIHPILHCRQSTANGTKRNANATGKRPSQKTIHSRGITHWPKL